jgi:hypothetical protein
MKPLRMFQAVAGLVFVATTARAGPPFQTDDPEPIDFRNFEFYTFGTFDGTNVEGDTIGPAVELNWEPSPTFTSTSSFPPRELFRRIIPALRQPARVLEPSG